MNNYEREIENYRNEVEEEFNIQLAEKISEVTGIKCSYYNGKIWVYKKSRNVEIRVASMRFISAYQYKGEAYAGVPFDEIKHNAMEKKLYKLLLEEEKAMEEKYQEMERNIDTYMKKTKLKTMFAS